MRNEERDIKGKKLSGILNEVSAMRTTLDALTSSEELSEYAVRCIKDLEKRLEKIRLLAGDLIDMEYPKQ